MSAEAQRREFLLLLGMQIKIHLRKKSTVLVGTSAVPGGGFCDLGVLISVIPKSA